MTTPLAGGAILLLAERVAGDHSAELRANLSRVRAEAKAERETAECLRHQLDAANMKIGALRSQLRQGGAP